MDSKSANAGDNPSASTSSIPNLVSSRRASIASITGSTRVDRETLSRALDQIHTETSQSEALTTFNKYTSPPSSSSGTDPKGIASELQGGLSGLYTRLRASVGNVKDIVNLGGEDGVGEATTAKVQKATSQTSTPSDKSRNGLHQVASFPTNGSPGNAAVASNEQSPIGTKSWDYLQQDHSANSKPPHTSTKSVTASSKSIAGSSTTIKSPPPNLTQAFIPSTVSPALAEVNISAIKQLRPSERSSPESMTRGSHVDRDADRNPSVSRSQSSFTRKTGADESDNGLPQIKLPESSKNDDFDSHNRKQYENQEDHITALQVPHASTNAGGSYGQDLEEITGSTEPKNASLTSGWEKIKQPVPTVSLDINTPDDVFQSSNEDDRDPTTDAAVTNAKYQHFELPLRKGLAPPIITKSHSASSIVSQESSVEVEGDVLVDSPIKQRLAAGSHKHDYPSEVGDSSPQLTPATAAHRLDSKTMNVSSQAKNKVLSKQYWMKDENARDCFYCGDPFSTFRRKHHCRTCGQIFDAKCTSLISAVHLGQSGTLRVCKPCESIIKGEDDSSEFSDDGTLSLRGLRPRHGSTGASDAFATPVSGQSPSKPRMVRRSSNQLDITVPTMSIPATRKAGVESSKKPTVLEIDAERSLARPTSSRSLKTSFANKPYHSAHRRHNSRHFLLTRGFKSIHEDNAPFHQDAVEEKRITRPLPAFHDDNIIDPDLAPYLSDEASSGDEQMSIMAVLQGDELSRSYDNDRHGVSGSLSSSRKQRSKAGEKSLSATALQTREGDSQSLRSSRPANVPRPSKRRNLSVTGNVYLRPSPRGYRANPALPLSSTNLHESTSVSALTQAVSSNSPSTGGARMIRSSSMRGAAAPAIELNHASMRHVRKLLHQLLENAKLQNVVAWEKALIPILLRATDDVNPNVQNGDDIDIRHYVKLKKIPGGRPGDTSYVSGLVFTKNLALKCMPRSLSHPNIIILSFPLEYARHQLHFMSLEPVIRQEREFLQNLVDRIVALRPQLLLVERNISGLALELLQQANIATAYNVKPSILEAVSRCCQTRIISSIDKLAVKPAQAGKCSSFYLKTYVHGRRKKTYMFLSGCPKELGCTIVLRGDCDATLAKMKRITEFMVYVVYNLKLETCLMRDEFAAIPSNTEIGTLDPGRDNLPRPFQGLLVDQGHGESRHASATLQVGESGASISDRSVTIASASGINTLGASEAENTKPGLPDEESVPDDVPMPTFYGDMVEEHKTKILSASPFVKFVPPYLLARAREQERRLAYLRRLRDQDIVEEENLDDKAKPQKFDLIKPEMVHQRVQTTSKKVREVLHAVHDAEYDKALHNYQTQSKQWEIYISTSVNLFDPHAHQNIAVLYSLVCTATTVPCSGPDILAFDFYNENEIDTGFEADCTLGQYVEDLTLGATTICTANGCERKMFDHHRQYVHGEAQLSVFVEQYPCKLRGLQDTILMWSICRKCDKETQVLPMSESTWKYSFGKYLELSFWCSELHARAGVCPHDLHRDHMRYFGFKDVALRLQYDTITLVEIIVPRARITWKVDNDLRFRNDLFTKIESRLNRFMLSVKARLKGINTDSVLPEKTESCKQEVEKLSKRAVDEHLALVQKIRDKYMNSKHYEIIPLNQALRAVQEKVAEWDATFTDFDQNFLPSEKDIRRLANLQLKKIFLDRDETVQPENSMDEGLPPMMSEKILNQKDSLDEVPALPPQTRRMSPEKTHDMLAAVVEKHASSESQNDSSQSAPATGQPSIPSEEHHSPQRDVERQDVRHLDLALPLKLPEDLRTQHQTEDDATEQEVEAATTGTGHLEAKVQTSSETPPLPKDSNSVMCSAGGSQVDQGPINNSGPSLVSGIPRPVDSRQRRAGPNLSPTLSRAQSQPTHLRHNKSPSFSSQLSSIATPPSNLENSSSRNDDNAMPKTFSESRPIDQKMPDRLAGSALKANARASHSMIPRSVVGRKKDSKVSNLAKHFEQLSREFEKERIRERRQRAANSRQARAYPMAASKPIVQIYRNVHEAVEEKEPSDEYLLSSDQNRRQESPSNTIDGAAETTPSQIQGNDGFPTEETTAENTETDENNLDSHIGSDVEEESDRSDEDRALLDSLQLPEDTGLDIKLDLPKHEKSSLMKILTNFWAERSASGWQPLDYPLNASDHIFADSDIIVREDEPSSLIAFALGSEDYQAKLRSILQGEDMSIGTGCSAEPPGPRPDTEQTGTEQSILRPTGKHLKYQFSEGSAKMLCKVFYAEQFDALRRKCDVSERFVESLSRCMKWDSKGGKTKSVFLKTLDDRFVLKSLSPVETQSFLQFAPGYFYVMSRFLFHDMPSVIAKMLGFFQITIKNPVTGVDFNWSLLVMENLFYDRSPARTFDLKGSMRNRRIQSTGEQNEVLLDENMVDFIYATPLFAREHSKRVLRASVYNDTLFLAKQNVMDYSLMVAVDEDRKELVVGIIDCIRTYTWDKKLETWIKDRGKNRPTVTSPKEYKSRFREAMSRYILQAPNCWHQFNAQHMETRPLRVDDQGDDREVQVDGL
ncbi:Mitochondrial distribution and morphology protein 12 [Lecanora helva]